MNELLDDRIVVVRRCRRVVERPEGVRLTALALLPELRVVGRRGERPCRSQLTRLLVRQLDIHVVTESFDVLTADVAVQLPDARTVQALRVEDQKSEDSHWIGVGVCDQYVERTRVAFAEGEEDRRSVHLE